MKSATLWVIHARGLLVICLLLFMAACTSIPPKSRPNPNPGDVTDEFSHELFDRVLQLYVDEQGRVDYTALQRKPADLEAYYALIALYSPDNHADLFTG